MTMRRLRDLLDRDQDEPRVDGRELEAPEEPGSDDRLLRGLLLLLLRRQGQG